MAIDACLVDSNILLPQCSGIASIMLLLPHKHHTLRAGLKLTLKLAPCPIRTRCAR